MRFQSSQPRFFNNLVFSDNIVTKSSTNIKKLYAEYSFSKLAPKIISQYLVPISNFKVEGDCASYSTERVDSPDLSIAFTNGEMSTKVFQTVLDLAFEYLNNRPTKNVSIKKFQSIHDELYLKKVDQRISDLTKNPISKQINALIKDGTKFSSITEIVHYYKKHLSIYARKRQNKTLLTVSHGDLCFSNMFITNEKLRLIDPKGAISESELYLDPYYDVAKLSHSVLGLYDFFNVGKYSVSLNNNLHFSLSFSSLPNQTFAKLFKDKLKDTGYDYSLVRLYEASLFLSMTPLHIDDSLKTFAFILNAINILKELSHDSYYKGENR